MDKVLNELMERSLTENEVLSQMIADIVPPKQEKFTNLEIEAGKKQEFSIVVYKKENVFVKIFKNIRFSLEKFKIIRHSRNFEVAGKREKC